jgi:hypothetical protein
MFRMKLLTLKNELNKKNISYTILEKTISTLYTKENKNKYLNDIYRKNYSKIEFNLYLEYIKHLLSYRKITFFISDYYEDKSYLIEEYNKKLKLEKSKHLPKEINYDNVPYISIKKIYHQKIFKYVYKVVNVNYFVDITMNVPQKKAAKKIVIKRTHISSTTKVCVLCNKNKPKEDFHSNGYRHGKKVFKNKCKACYALEKEVNKKPKEICEKEINTFKECILCKEELPLSSFRKEKSKTGSFYYRKKCKKCS